MKTILGIDPGTLESAYTIYNGNKVLSFDKVKNEEMINFVIRNSTLFDECAIEMIKSYGMPMGDSILETCVFIGRLKQTLLTLNKKVELVYRKSIVTHICNNPRANDSNVKQALVNRFAKYDSNHGKGTKSNKGFFYGFHSDIWQSFAVTIFYYDTRVNNA